MVEECVNQNHTGDAYSDNIEKNYRKSNLNAKENIQLGMNIYGYNVGRTQLIQ